jgi:hypothetical protein
VHADDVIAAGGDVVAAHKELRTRLTYEVGVIIAQKERKAERERRRQQQQQQQQQQQEQYECWLKHSQLLSTEPIQATDARGSISVAALTTSATGSTTAGTAHDDDIHEDTAACADMYENDDEFIAFQRSAAAAEVAAADAGCVHWGKLWVAAAATAEKG